MIHIGFVADAQHRSMWRQLQPTKPILFDDFLRPVIDSTNDWVVAANGTNDSVAHQANAGGAARITTGTADNDTTSIASGLVWLGSKNPFCEAKITITDVSGTVLFFGFTDATSEDNGKLPLDYSGEDAALAATATDAAGLWWMLIKPN